MSWNQILTFIAFSAAPLIAQSRQPHQAPKRPKSVRIYVFDCGSLGSGLVVPCYLIAHPKGTLVWDVGLTPDSDLKAGATNKSLTAQLASVGYVPEDITYLSFSHYHSDHTANANLFGRSTWLVSKAERDIMFSDPPRPRFVEIKTYSTLKDSKTTILPATSDYDVFGDGTVVIKPVPGHTPGHQVLFVKLVKTGPILVAGDLYSEQKDRDANKVSEYDWNGEQLLASRAKIEAFLKTSRAQLWIEHDGATFAKLKKAPEFYE
jgi:glyoxylase-like metal-dependent hydrolase (beta-lactamase superfamily II)